MLQNMQSTPKVNRTRKNRTERNGPATSQPNTTQLTHNLSYPMPSLVKPSTKEWGEADRALLSLTPPAYAKGSVDIEDLSMANIGSVQ
jgi:hypothetical protein